MPSRPSKPKLVFLESPTLDERREMPKLGDKSVAFVRKSVEMARTGAGHLPGAFDTRGFRADLGLFDTLLPIRQRVVQLQEKIEAAMMLPGSDLYVVALDHYAAVRAADGLIPARFPPYSNPDPAILPRSRGSCCSGRE